MPASKKVVITALQTQDAHDAAPEWHVIVLTEDRVGLLLEPSMDPESTGKDLQARGGGETPFLYAERHRPGIVQVGTIASKADHYRVRHLSRFSEHSGCQVHPSGPQVASAVIQLAVQSFESWKQLGERAVDELEGKTWATDPKVGPHH